MLNNFLTVWDRLVLPRPPRPPPGGPPRPPAAPALPDPLCVTCTFTASSNDQESSTQLRPRFNPEIGANSEMLDRKRSETSMTEALSAP